MRYMLFCTILLVGSMVSTSGPVRAQIGLSVDGVVASLTGGFQFPDGTIQATAVGPLLARVPKTGQQQCFDVDGNVVSCSGTGQDGDLQRGVDRPTPRFTVTGDGTVTDNLTGLIWLQDANCFGERNWDVALLDAGDLEAGFCGLLDGSQPGDWRLPSAKELISLIDFGRSAPALPDGHPFVDVLSDGYWTSTTNLVTDHHALKVIVESGILAGDSKVGEPNQVWPVRGGR